MSYTPRPIATEDIQLTPQLRKALELISKNTHEVWAYGRMEEGWVYANTHDANAKTHPSLVPYDELSEAEKDYDRRTSEAVIKVLLKLGYEILPPQV